MEVTVQFIGLLLLVAGMALGYWRWIRPYGTTITTAGRGLLLLVLATLVGGFIGSPFWWFDFSWSFSWDLPPLASRMLASAGWSFFAVSLIAIRHPLYRRLRLILLLLFVYLVPLTIVILLFHRDRFNFSAPITYGFFIIVLLMVLATIYYLLRQPRIIPDEERANFPANVVIQVWLFVVATITLLWGLALLVTDSGPTALVWAWPGDLLSSRLIGVMLLTITFGVLYAFRYADIARMMLVMIVVYSLGITVASLWNLLFGLPIKTFYTAVFSVIFLVSTILLFTNKQPNRMAIQSTT